MTKKKFTWKQFAGKTFMALMCILIAGYTMATAFASENFTYSTAAATNYAYTYVNTPNKPTYPFYENGDCANFVSQILHAGGVPMTSTWKCNARLGGVLGYDITVAWSQTPRQMEYLLSEQVRGQVIGNYSVKNRPNAINGVQYNQSGIVVYYDWLGTGNFTHTAYSTGQRRYNSESWSVVYSHTNARAGVKWDLYQFLGTQEKEKCKYRVLAVG